MRPHPPRACEQSGYWQQWFATLAKDPAGLAIWRSLFQDMDVGAEQAAPHESLRQAKRRHVRKLKAMQIALVELKVPELDGVMQTVRQQLLQ